MSRGSRWEGNLASRDGRQGSVLAVGPSLRKGVLEVGKVRWSVDLMRKGDALGTGAHNRGGASGGHTRGPVA